jgi:hypothetical protein
VLGGGAALAGAGAIAGALAHRRGVFGLLALGIVLGGASASVALLETELDDGVGVRTERPLTVSEIPETYRLGVGELDIDLRDTELPPGRTTIRARVAVGDLTVLVPAGVRVASVGPTHVDGVRAVNDQLSKPPAGKGRRARLRAEIAAAARPTIQIDADIREGDADVIRTGG